MAEKIISKEAHSFTWGMGNIWGPEINGLPVGAFVKKGSRRIRPTSYTSEAEALASIEDAEEFERHTIPGFRGECAVLVEVERS